MPKIRSFRDDTVLEQKLDAIPVNERSTIIRMALRKFFAELEQKDLIAKSTERLYPFLGGKFRGKS